jgi:hypothetical protein
MPGIDDACPQKPNPSRETVPLISCTSNTLYISRSVRHIFLSRYVYNITFFLVRILNEKSCSCVRAGGPVGSGGRNLADPDQRAIRRSLRQERGGRLLQLQALGVPGLSLRFSHSG